MAKQGSTKKTGKPLCIIRHASTEQWHIEVLGGMHLCWSHLLRTDPFFAHRAPSVRPVTERMSIKSALEARERGQDIDICLLCIKEADHLRQEAEEA